MTKLPYLFGTVVLALMVLSPVSVRADAPDSLQAGAAAIDISPQTLPALMNGGFLQNRSDRVADPLHARALVVTDGGETIAIVVVDSCMLPKDLCDEIKSLATNKTGIASDRILISATHTHSAPSAMSMCLGCGRDDAYVKQLPSQVAQSIADAHASLQPVKIGWAIVDGSDLTNCRRWITRSDRMGMDPFGGQTVRAMMHPGYQNPNFTSPAGPIDPWLSVLSVITAKDETPICVMSNLSMHYFGSGGGFSADYFGEVVRMVEARIGQASGKPTPGFVGIMSQGTSGDLHWMDYSQPQRPLSRHDYAEAVTERVLEAWKTIEHRADLSLAAAEKRITLGRRLPSSERLQWARPINVARLDHAPRNREEVYAQQAQWIDENPQEEIVLQAIRIGDLAMTAIPCEVYGITGLKLKRQSPLAATVNFELANGAAGYIPPPEQHQLGGYTTWPARTAGLEEQAEPAIVETVLGLLETITGKKRRALKDPDTPYSKAIQQSEPIAYWRLGDMNSTRAEDSIGANHASYRGGVALFLPGPHGTGFEAPDYGNRSVYLAGGHLEASFEKPLDQFSVSLWISNELPADARDVTGTLLSNEAVSLSITGTAVGGPYGKLTLRTETRTFVGKTPIVDKGWHQVTITKNKDQVRVFLDGMAEPEIDAVTSMTPTVRWLIGSDGNSSTTFDGKVDEVVIYDRALSTSEIVELYAASGMTPPPRPQPPIVLGPKPSDSESRKRYADAVLASMPFAFWRLSDESNRSASDVMGRFPAVYENGSSSYQAGSAVPNFSGGRVKAVVPQLGNTYSVELWCRNELPVGVRPVTAYLFSRAVDGVDGASGDNLGIGGTHSNTGRLFVFNGNQRDQIVAGRTRLQPGSWSHIVMVRQDQRMTVYLDGNPDPEIDADLPIAYPMDCSDLLLGGRSDQFANLQGMLEEVALYDRALTPEEARSHFVAAHPQVVQGTPPDQPDEASRPMPTEAVDALGTIHVRDGFDVQLVAAEPLVMDPVAIDWGTDGKLWVVEMADYPLGVDGNGKPGGRVRYLEDTDRDGRYDKSTLFAEGLSFPTGVLKWGDGILVTAAPEILYLEDTSGDGKADVRRALYSGFLEGNQQLRVNGLRWGLDNWIYCASGSHHAGYGKDSQIVSHVTGTKYPVGSRDFRIRPDTGEIDAQSGPSQFGRNRDDWGNWFGVQNSHPLWHYVLADHNIRRNPHYAPPDPKRQVVTPTNPPVYPASTLQKRYHSFDQSGRFTSACSAMVYRDDLLFDRTAEQHAFTCEPFHNLVQHNVITDDGVSFRFHRDPAEAEIDFFASEDRWCRPVMVRTGPDGALWVVDMYRYMIEHPQWLPQVGKDELLPWYRSGSDRGRIYRIVPTDRPARRVPRLDDLSPDELASILESSNGWQRDTAQRLLVRGKQQAAIAPLREMVKRSEEPLARIHALFTLDGLEALSADTLEAALTDSHAGVRRIAVQIASHRHVDVNKLCVLVDDPNAKVRLELGSTLGDYADPAASLAMAKLAVSSDADGYIKAAVLSSLSPQNVSSVLDAAIQFSDEVSSSIRLELITQAVAMSDLETVEHVIDRTTSDSPGDQVRADTFESLVRILDGLTKRRWSIDSLSQTAQRRISETIRQARLVAVDPGAEAYLRAISIPLLGREAASQLDDFAMMQSLLVPQSPVVLQRAIVAYLAERTEPSVAAVLLSGWQSHSPELRIQILEVLPSRQPWSDALRRSLQDGAVRVSELSATVRQRLLDGSQNSPEWEKVLANHASADRAEVMNRFRPSLGMDGDAPRGAIIFRKLCINCHKVNDEGHEVGPQLVSITDKSKESLFASILDPSAAVDAKYFNYAIITDDGRSLNGRIESETGSSITLLADGGKRETVLRSEIDALKTSAKSLMPEGLEQGLEAQDLADLIHFVRETFR